jgi:hypothetical protein
MNKESEMKINGTGQIVSDTTQPKTSSYTHTNEEQKDSSKQKCVEFFTNK